MLYGEHGLWVRAAAIMSPSRSRSRNQYELSDENDGPSRTQLRRDALIVLELAEQLVELPPSRVANLELPEAVREEIANVHKITAHIARKRQLAFLAKVMRRYGKDEFVAVHAALGENRDRQRQETAAMHRMEALRERLIEDTEGQALGELIAQHQNLDRQRLRSLIRQARLEKASPNKPPKAYREIFQILKELATQAVQGETD